MINYLKLVPLFSSLNDEELDAINRQSFIKKYPKNNIILVENEKGDTLYIIVKGKVKVTKFSESGEEIILAILHKGDFFGDMSLLDGKPRSATVVSNEDSELILIRRNDFENVVEKNPRIALKLLKELTTRLRNADEFIGNLVFLKVTGRIAGILLQLSKERGIKIDDGVLIKSRPSHQELASMVGATRETVTRVLKQLENSKYISMTGKDITIHDIDIFRQNLYL